MKKIIPALLTGAAAALFIWGGREAAAEAKKAVSLCLTVIIPSLYAFTVITKLLAASGFFRLAGRLFRFFSVSVLRVREDIFPVLLLSQIGGYPIGAGILSEMAERGDISESEAKEMLCFCIAPGPAYIMAVTAAIYPDNPRLWTVPFLGVLCANFIPLILTAPMRKKPTVKDTPPLNVKLDAADFTAAVSSGAEAMASITGMIVFASAFMGVMGKAGIMPALSAAAARLADISPAESYTLVRSFFEISNLTRLTGRGEMLLPAAAALLSFGGICVHLQIMSVCKGFSPLKALLLRVPSAFIAFFVCRAAIPKSLFIEAVTVMAPAGNYVKIHQTKPILSVFLLIMTILILSEKTIVKSEKI